MGENACVLLLVLAHKFVPEILIFIIDIKFLKFRAGELKRPENGFYRFYLILLFNNLYRNFVIKITISCLEFFLEMIQNGLVYATPKENELDKTENVR